MRSALVAAASAVLLSSLATPVAAQSQDEQAIRSLIQQWVKLVAAKNANAVADMYTPDGAVMPPNAPLAEGREAIAATWRNMMQAPGFQLTFTPTRIEVSKGGDMAMDRGTYRLVTQGTSGPVEDRGKYVVVWRKIDGRWKAAADIFNSDLP
jgi:uncharacterized protein (TIGR02246 family)